MPLTTIALWATVLASEPPAWRAAVEQFAAGCLARRNAYASMHLSGKRIRTTVKPDLADAVASIVLASHGVCERGRTELVLSAVLQALPVRECYDYSIWTDAAQAVVDNNRDLACDTMREHVFKSGWVDHQIISPEATERIYTNSVDTLIVQDRSKSSGVKRITRDQLLRVIDPTLIDWTPLRQLADSGPDRTICFAPSDSEPGLAEFTVTVPGADGGLAGGLRVDVAHGFRPVSVRSVSKGTLHQGVDFLYSTDSDDNLPVVVLDRTLSGSAEDRTVQIEMFLFDRVEVGEGVVVPPRRLPALRVELVELPVSGDLLVSRAMPERLRSTSPAERLGVALAEIAGRWGTTDSEFDLDGDGVIGEGDIQRAMDTF